MEQTTVSARIPERLYTSIEEAANAHGLFRSEVVRQALRYYVEQNPDDFSEFTFPVTGDDVSVNNLTCGSACQLQEETETQKQS